MSLPPHLGDEPLETDIPTRPVRQKRTRKAKAPVPQEAAIQRAIIDALRWKWVYCVHVPNSGKRSTRAGRRVKGEGMRPGFPDLALYMRGGRHGLLEVKRPGYSPSDVSDNQRDMHARMREMGIPCAIVTSVDEALAALREWGWL